MARVFLDWSATGPCDGYTVYRKSQEDVAFPSEAMAILPAQQLCYEDATVVYGETYTYGVYAFAAGPGESTWGSLVTVEVLLPKPSVPGPATATVTP